MLGFGAYADSSRLVNDEVRQFKQIKSQTEALNKELQVQAGQAKTLSDLKTLGEEFGLKQTKDLLKKYGPKLYKAKIPYANTSIQDVDKTVGKGLDEVIEGAKQRGSEALDEVFNAGKNIPPPLASQQGSQLGYQNKLNADPEMEEIQNIRENNLAQRALPPEQMYERQIITPDPRDQVKPAQEAEVRPAEVSPAEVTPVEELAQGGVEAAEKIGAEAAEKAGAEAAGQAAAAGFAATGVLAPVGAAVELGVDIWSIFEGAKSVGDIINRDVLGNTTSVNAPQAVIPKRPLTLAQKGFQVTPSIDTYDMPHSTVSMGW